MGGDSLTVADQAPPSPAPDWVVILRDAAHGVGRAQTVAWACLYDTFARLLLAYIVGSFGKRWQFDVEDVIQDVFVLARRDIHQFVVRGDAYASFKRWLFTIARNQVLRAARKATRERPDDDTVEKAAAPSSGASEARRLLEELTEDLSEEDMLIATRHGVVGIALKDLVPEILEHRAAQGITDGGPVNAPGLRQRWVGIQEKIRQKLAKRSGAMKEKK